MQIFSSNTSTSSVPRVEGIFLKCAYQDYWYVCACSNSNLPGLASPRHSVVVATVGVCVGCHCIITREDMRSHLLYRSPTAIGNVSVTYVTSVP